MAKSYEDIAKESSEFITKGFPNSGVFKLSTESKTPNGVTIKASATRSFDFKDKDVVEEKLSAEIEPKIEFKEEGIEVNGKLTTGGEFEGGVSFVDIGTHGTKVSFSGIQSDKDGSAVKGSVAYKHPQVTVKVGAKVPLKQNTHVNYNAEATFKHENFHVGADVRFDQAVRGEAVEVHQLHDRALYNVRGGYLSDSQHFVLSVENQLHRDKKTILNLFAVNYLYFVSYLVRFGFAASVERNNLRGTEVAVGGEYKVDKDTTLRGKFTVVQAIKEEDREFRVGLAAKQNLSDRVNVTVGADINARALLGAPNHHKLNLGTTKPHSFGFEVKFQ